jgi:3-methyl-2-oxobutanoate hydroxymethyltransferase
MYNASNGGGARSTRTTAKLTAPELGARKVHAGGTRIAMVTAYDYTMARLVDEAGVDMVLVGDSLGMIVQGMQNTIPVTLDEMIYHTRAVSRGLQRAHLVGDMPFGSYQVSPAQAVESAARLMKEGFAESVKLEGGIEVAEHVHRIVRTGIPVVGHVGLTPQSVHALGGFKVQGRGDDAAEKVMRDARALEDAGAFAIVLEAIPPDLADLVTRALSIPTIGIGAGVGCDGQVLVCTDLLGMSRGHRPKFAKAFAPIGDAIVDAVSTYVRDVQSGTFPAPEHAYKANNAPNVTAAPAAPRQMQREEAASFDDPLPLDLWH